MARKIWRLNSNGVEVYLTKMVPRTYKNDKGEIVKDFEIDVKKRGDFSNQKTIYDGGFITNEHLSKKYRKKVNHTKVISRETGLKILQVNGINDFMKDIDFTKQDEELNDYAEIMLNHEKPLSFSANIQGSSKGNTFTEAHNFWIIDQSEDIKPSERPLTINNMLRYELENHQRYLKNLDKWKQKRKQK